MWWTHAGAAGPRRWGATKDQQQGKCWARQGGVGSPNLAKTTILSKDQGHPEATAGQGCAARRRCGGAEVGPLTPIAAARQG